MKVMECVECPHEDWIDRMQRKDAELTRLRRQLEIAMPALRWLGAYGFECDKVTAKDAIKEIEEVK